MRSSDTTLTRTALELELRAEYAAAALEYAADPDFALWESTVGDGLDEADDLEPSLNH